MGSVLPSVVINLSETVTVSDAVDVQPEPPVEIQVTESILVSDDVAVSPSAMITVTEQITVTVADQVGLIVGTSLFADGFESGDTSAWSATGGG